MRIAFFLFFFSIAIYAQKDTIQLKEVEVYGSFSKKYNSGYYLKVLQDSVFKTNANLKEVLQEQANIYFKEYGNGMVSSISLRGSNASQTAVYFNGIAINSVLNGQTDFNTINVQSFNQISIKKGGGSTALGSGAIGGAINLSDIISYNKKQQLWLQTAFGSYQTYHASLQFQKANRQFYQKYAVSALQSKNDYPYLHTNQKNENGAYKQLFLKSVFGYQINAQSEFNFFATYTKNNRDLSGTLTAPSFSTLKNENIRMVLRYKNSNQVLKQQVDLAFLQEYYRFYLYKNQAEFSYGKANNYILKYKTAYFLSNIFQFFAGAEGKIISGKGSDIQQQKNQQAEFFLLSHFKPNKKFQSNINFRKGFASNFKIPFIYSVDALYKMDKNIEFKANFSTNYRLPTINDLYWKPNGNPHLKPENNISYEVGVGYRKSFFKFNINGFYTKSKNLIQWQPLEGNFWQPKNIQEVVSKGVETETAFRLNRMQINLQYSFTDSKDVNLKKQLIYVPFHKGNANIAYIYQQWKLNWNTQYSGKVYTTTSNTQQILDYWLNNLRFNRKIPKWHANLGLKINNIFNQYYEMIAFRPMPNRNYQLYFNIQF